MDEDFFDKYREAWRRDADELMDKVSPPTEQLIENVLSYERRRRRRRTAFLSGIAAMLLLAVTVVFFIPTEADSAPIPMVASVSPEEQAADTCGAPSGTTLRDAAPLQAPQRADEAGYAIAATPRPKALLPEVGNSTPTLPHDAETHLAQANIGVTHLDDYPLDNSHAVPATVLTAMDSASWEWLSTLFALASDAPSASAESVQFVQRSLKPSDVDRYSASLGMDTGSYLLGALPMERSVVVIHYESIPDLIDLRGGHPSYAEKDTHLNHQQHRSQERLPKDNEKMPNRHNVIINSPTYYQTIVPGGNTDPRQIRR